MLNFDPLSVTGTTFGDIDVLSHIDALPGLFQSVGPARIPLGAPMTLSGWAVDPNGDLPAEVVAVSINATFVFAAETGFGRYDVKALLGERTPEKIGFRALVPTDMLLPGNHELRAYALSADGVWYQAAYRPFSVHRPMRPEMTISSHRVAVHVDTVDEVTADGKRGPLAAIVPSGHFVSINGWAVDHETKRAPAGICAVDDVSGRWNACCDVVRADARAASGATDERLGFEILIPADALGRGRHVLSMCAFDRDGRRFSGSAEAKVEIAAPMREFPGFASKMKQDARAAAVLQIGDRETPIVMRVGRTIEIEPAETIVIEGWAVASEDTAPGQIILELEPLGITVPPLRYHPISGYHRAKPQMRLAPPLREDSWFYYELDPSNLAAQTYALNVAVISGDGCGYARGQLGTLRVVEDESTGSTRRR